MRVWLLGRLIYVEQLDGLKPMIYAVDDPSTTSIIPQFAPGDFADQMSHVVATSGLVFHRQ